MDSFVTSTVVRLLFTRRTQNSTNFSKLTFHWNKRLPFAAGTGYSATTVEKFEAVEIVLDLVVPGPAALAAFTPSGTDICVP